MRPIAERLLTTILSACIFILIAALIAETKASDFPSSSRVGTTAVSDNLVAKPRVDGCEGAQFSKTGRNPLPKAARADTRN